MIAQLLNFVKEGRFPGKWPKRYLKKMVAKGGTAEHIIAAKGLLQISDKTALMEVIVEVIAENPENLKKYLAGKNQIFGYFVGEVMKRTSGKANPGLVNSLLKEKLSEFAG